MNKKGHGYDDNFIFSMEKEDLINDFENYLLSISQRLETIRTNKGNAALFMEWLEESNRSIIDVGYTDLLEYINYCKERGNTKSTINGKLQGIRHLYDYLESGNKVAFNPVGQLRLKGIIRRQPHDILEWEELEEMYKNYPSEGLSGKRNKTIIGMMIYQGIRNGEIGQIEVTDVRLEEAKVFLPSAGRSKGRSLIIESVQILQLQNYITRVRPSILSFTKKQTDKLFMSLGSGKNLNNTISRVLKAAKKMNPRIKSGEQIRQSVITHWLKNHGVREVQYMAGHRYVSSTERYRTDILETLQEKIDEFHPLK